MKRHRLAPIIETKKATIIFVCFLQLSASQLCLTIYTSQYTIDLNCLYEGKVNLVKIQFHGQSCVQITHEGISLIIDPFLSGNPVASTKASEIKVDYVLLTHAHGDHMADAVEIAKQNDATVIATFELASYLTWQGVKTHAMNIGGSYSFEFGKVKMTQAFHSSGHVVNEDKQIIYMGMPVGFLLKIDGKTLFHAGDTGLYSDLKMYGELEKIDLSFLPIGDNYTMGPEDALLAAEWLRTKTVIPVHFNTFQLIQQDGAKFVRDLQALGIEGRCLNPGETTEF
jgi:L-ascorbate metabolism protein UlaG (beta-lactamase superfamily)